MLRKDPDSFELHLLDAPTTLKAKHDSYWLLKKELVKFCLDLAFYNKHSDEKISQIKNRLTDSRVFYFINNYANPLADSIKFDQRTFATILTHALDYQPPNYFLNISSEVVNQIDGYTGTPERLPTPLVYDSIKMTSLIKKPFWGRVEKDVFGHEALIVVYEGVDKCFGILNPYVQPYPIFTQPFLLAGDVNPMFEKYDTTFAESLTSARGLLKLWFGIELKF